MVRPLDPIKDMKYLIKESFLWGLRYSSKKVASITFYFATSISAAKALQKDIAKKTAVSENDIF